MFWDCPNLNQTVIDGVAHSKNPRKFAYHVTFDLDLDLEHNVDAGLPGDHCVQVWLRSSHLPWRRSNFRASTKVPVACDLWPWPWPWAYPGCILTWSPSCESLVAIRPFACEKKRFAQKFTDGQTDGQTTDASPLYKLMEWAKNVSGRLWNSLQVEPCLPQMFHGVCFKNTLCQPLELN